MKWRIGDWVACTDTDTVRNENELVQQKIERRAMAALVVMAERAGQVIRKDELIEIVWGRLAVSDHSVAMVISQLRRALKDDVRAPKYIQTITKRGYRLIAPCEPCVETAVGAVRGTERGSITRQPQAGLVLASAGVAVAGLGALSALFFF